jgi:hypothetical protein
MFADDQILKQDSQDKLQCRLIHTSHSNGETYNLNISTKKIKVMALKGNLPVRTKLTIDSNILEQVFHCSYLERDITYMLNKDLIIKLNKYDKIYVTVRRTLKTKTREDTQLKCYKMFALPTLLYGSESWAIKTRDIKYIQQS